MDVELKDLTAEMPHPPGSRAAGARGAAADHFRGRDVDTLRYFRFTNRRRHRRQHTIWLSRTGYSGELGFELYCKPEDATELWNAVLAGPARTTGSSRSASPRSRRSASDPALLFPDIDYFPHQTDPFEVRLDNVIKLDNDSDFVGREALERIASQGTARLLTTLRIDGDGGARVRRRGDGRRRRGRHRPQPLHEPWASTR